MSRRAKSAGTLTVGVLALALTWSAGATTPVASQSGRKFFQGKSLTIIVPYSPGGGYDKWARLIAPRLQRYLSLGRVIVQNRDGAGGLVGTNAIYSATPDGLTIGDTNAGGDVFSQMAQYPGVRFNVSRLSWIGRPEDDPHVLAVQPDGPLRSFDDLIAMRGSGEIVRSLATSVGSSDYSATTVIYNVFGVPYHMVAAFKGSHGEKATFVSGLGDATTLSASDIAELGDKARVLLVFTAQPYARLPAVPTVLQEMHAHPLPQNSMRVLSQLVSVMALGHAFVAPPGVPQDRLEALRDAFQSIVHDRSFIAEATRADLYIGYRSGEQLQQDVASAMAHTDEFRRFLVSH